MDWQPIATAPKDGSTIDLWAKFWRADVDSFIVRRFPSCYWTKDDSMGGGRSHWRNFDNAWCPTHWMALPAPPKEPDAC